MKRRKAALDQVIREWFQDHTAIDRSKFEREAGIPFRSLRDFLNGKYGLTDNNRELILRRLPHYGYDEKQAARKVKAILKERINFD